MFAEMLIHSEEKIFLEAIDQYFENESFENIDKNNKVLLIENTANQIEKEEESQIDKDKETDIEMMNIKFYEALNIDKNETKDISTDLESEDNNLNAEKAFIKISHYLILNKESIEEHKQKIFNEYKNQIILEEKIKELFKKDDIKEKYLNNNSELNNKSL